MSPKKTFTGMPNWLSFALAFTFVVTGIAVSVLAFLTGEAVVAAAQQPFNPLEEAAADVSGTALPPLLQEGPVPIPTLEADAPTPVPTIEIEKTSERTNILVMGIDRRPGEPFISRTDTMILVSINPENNSASMLSIPRDLYVVIPNRGRDRINTAMVYGSAGNNPAAGAELAMQTVEYNLGVTVDHYLMVDFNAFIQAIDTVGGITVEVPYDIYDPQYPDMNYGYDPLHIPAGTHQFDGATALKYARTRHQDNDIYRAQRQQQVMMALRSKVMNLGADQLLRQLPLLYNQFKEGIRTDMSLEQMGRLALTARDIPPENINRAVLDYNYLTGYTTERGASVLVLINEAAAPLIQELFFDS